MNKFQICIYIIASISLALFLFACSSNLNSQKPSTLPNISPYIPDNIAQSREGIRNENYDNSDLQKRILTLESEISSLQKRISSIDSQIPPLRGQVNQLEGNISRLEQAVFRR